VEEEKNVGEKSGRPKKWGPPPPQQHAQKFFTTKKQTNMLDDLTYDFNSSFIKNPFLWMDFHPCLYMY
jgi:hypothetical protein